MDATIRIFMEVLADVVDKYEFEAFIHPVVPVLNETRQLVIQYNEIFKKHVRKSKVCKWLDFFDDLVYDSPDEKVRNTKIGCCGSREEKRIAELFSPAPSYVDRSMCVLPKTVAAS